MIQFVCVRRGRESYRSLTADHICIHPGSVMFRQDPVYIVAGEIVRTSRIFAMSVSPLTKTMLDQINPDLYERLNACKKAESKLFADVVPVQKKEKKDNKKAEKFLKTAKTQESIPENYLSIGNELFETTKIKGKKTALLPLDKFIQALSQEKDEKKLSACGNLKGRIVTSNHGMLLDGEKLSTIIEAAKNLNLAPISEKEWNRKLNANINDPFGKEQILNSLDIILRTAISKQKNKEYGFITLYTDGNGTYWFKTSRGYSTALTESHSSLETLIEENIEYSKDEEDKINTALRLVNKLYN